MIVDRDVRHKCRAGLGGPTRHRPRTSGHIITLKRSNLAFSTVAREVKATYEQLTLVSFLTSFMQQTHAILHGYQGPVC